MPLPASSVPVPELLAPAGDAEALRAAVANGADAVYFGLGDFNARHRATNFTLEELPATMQYLHEHGVRGYVTFNTLIFTDEISRAIEYLTAIAQAGADAVIVQDLGLARLIHRMLPTLPVHGSTQMTLTEPRGIEFVRRLGVERAIVARELSIDDIVAISKNTQMPLEVFVHGALCVAYSGQCLTSESLGGRSANRGQCAQACRQPYEMIVDGEPRELGDKAYLLSPQDLAAYDLIAPLTAAGVCSVKIEGRLKSAHYVAATSQTYRAALEAARWGQPFELTRQQELDLSQTFSRGFTHGFLSGVNHQELVHGRAPKARGVKLGTILRVTRDGVVIALDEQHSVKHTAPDGQMTDELLPVKPGDGVVIDEGKPEQDEQGGRLFQVRLVPAVPPKRQVAPMTKGGRPEKSAAMPRRAPTGPTEVELNFGRGDVNLKAVEVGSLVWKTDDPAMRKRLERSWAGNPQRHPTTFDIEVRGNVGELLTVKAKLAGSEPPIETSVSWNQPLSAAVKHELDKDVVREQFSRLGGTPFQLGDVTLLVNDHPVGSLPVMVPKSVLNELRRTLVENLTHLRRRTRPEPTIHTEALDELRANVTALRADPIENQTSKIENLQTLSVLVHNMDQLRAVLDWQPPEGLPPADSVYCDFEEIRLSKNAVALCRDRGMPIALATPRIIKPGEEGLLRQVANCKPDAVLVRNLAGLTWFRENTPDLLLVGDYSLNIANDLTAGLFLEQGLVRLTPSYDLNLEQLQALLQHVDPHWFEVVLHQHLPMFHMEHCVFSHVLSNGKDFRDCGRPCDRHAVELKDHVGESHPLVADVGCRNTLFNARAQSAAPYLPQLKEWGVQHFRVELLRESPAETVTLLDAYAHALSGQASTPATWQHLRVLSQLGVTRGTMEFE